MMFLNSETGEDVIQRILAVHRADPLEAVLLSQSLEIDVRAALGLAEPDDDTVVLLRPQHVVRRTSLAALVPKVLVAASLVALAGALLH